MENNQNQQFGQPGGQQQVPEGPTKNCKHCNSIIPKSAKVCPQCRKKQGGIVKWIVLAVVVIIIIAAIGGGGNKDDKNTTGTSGNSTTDDAANTTASSNKDQSSEKAQEEKTSFSVGETATQNDVNVTLISVTESNGPEYLSADDGNIFVICEFEIENNSSKDISVSSMVSFEAYCDDYSIMQDIIGLQSDEAKGKSQLDGSVAAGKKMNGVITYQVPAEWHTLEINFTPSFWSSKDITFTATK